MSFFKKLSETVMDTASSIGAKSADLVETGKTKLQRSQLESSIKDKKTVIGDLLYQAHQLGETTNMDTLNQLFSEIADLENQIATLDEKLRKETNQATPSAPGSEGTSAEPSANFIYCSQCGQQLAVGAKFCNKCGSAQ